MNELDALRQEAETLKNAIRVSIRGMIARGVVTGRKFDGVHGNLG